MFMVARWIEANDLKEITERQILKCMEERCKRKIIGSNVL